jgi:hypothetical protein
MALPVLRILLVFLEPVTKESVQLVQIQSQANIVMKQLAQLTQNVYLEHVLLENVKCVTTMEAPETAYSVMQPLVPQIVTVHQALAC